MDMVEKEEVKTIQKLTANIGYRIRDIDGNVVAYVQVRNVLDGDVKKKLIIKLYDKEVGVKIDEVI